MNKNLKQIAVPLVSVLLGLVLGAIIMWAFSYDALWGYELLFKKAFGSIKSWGNISRAMGPLILVALGFSVASRAGFFNVGLPGQAFAGWIMATWFALSFPNMPRLLMIPMTVLIAAVAGGFIGAIPGFLRAYLGTSEVIITIMMNYIVLYGGNALIHSFPASLMKNKDSTVDVGANAVYQTEWLRNLTDKSQMNIGIFFAIIAVVVIWFLMKKTTLGFEIRAVGLNANAAEYAGMSAKRTIILSMIISGALAGIGDAIDSGTMQYIFIAIAIPWAQEGSALGALFPFICFALYQLFVGLFFARQGFSLGRNATSLVHSSGVKDAISLLSILGLFMMGILAGNYVKVTSSLQFTLSGKNFVIQELLDKIVPGILPLAVVMGVYYYFVKKGLKVTQALLWLTLILIVLASVGIL